MWLLHGREQLVVRRHELGTEQELEVASLGTAVLVDGFADIPHRLG